MAGAVAFAAPSSAIQCAMNDGMSNELLDINESFYFDHRPWTGQSIEEDAFHSAQQRHLTTEDDHDHPPITSIISQQLLSDITEPMGHLFPDDVSLDSWRTTYPEQWTSEDVLNLIYSIAMQSRDIDLADFYGEKFQDVDGTRLCSMTERDFTDRDRKYGRLLHGWIKKFLIQSHPHDELPPPPPMSVKREEQDNATTVTSVIPTDIPITVEEVSFDDIFGNRYDIDSPVDFYHIQATPAMTSVMVSNSTEVSTKDILYQNYQHNTPIPNQLQQQQQQHLHHQSLTQHHHHQQQQQQQLPLLPADACLNANRNQYRHSLGECKWPVALHNRQRAKGVRRDGSYSSDEDSSSDDGSSGGYSAITVATASFSSNGNPQDEMGSVRAMNGVKGNHLWEFLCQQLRRSETIPFRDRLIQWESREDGVFRIMDSKEIAVQWGLFKGNDKMTYEKLSRALRWCRTNGFLATLPKDGKFPKKLCFRFGPKATHWRDFV